MGMRGGSDTSAAPIDEYWSRALELSGGPLSSFLLPTGAFALRNASFRPHQATYSRNAALAVAFNL